MKDCRYLSVLIVILLLNGCSLLSQDTKPQVWLKPDVTAVLPPPVSNQAFTRQQFLTATVNGKSETLTTKLNVENDRLTLIGLSASGDRLFKITYSPDGILLEQPKTLPQLPHVKQILADMMLSYRPVREWKPLLPQGWTLKDESNKRLLHDNHGNPVVEINYRNQNGKREPISIAQYAFKYHILILNIDD